MNEETQDGIKHGFTRPPNEAQNGGRTETPNIVVSNLAKEKQRAWLMQSNLSEKREGSTSHNLMMHYFNSMDT